jgi:hypothetical protein
MTHQYHQKSHLMLSNNPLLINNDFFPNLRESNWFPSPKDLSQLGIGIVLEATMDITLKQKLFVLNALHNIDLPTWVALFPPGWFYFGLSHNWIFNLCYLKKKHNIYLSLEIDNKLSHFCSYNVVENVTRVSKWLLYNSIRHKSSSLSRREGERTNHLS